MKRALIVGGVIIAIIAVAMISSDDSSEVAGEPITLPDWNLIEKDSQRILIAGMKDKESCYRAAPQYATGDKWDCGYNCASYAEGTTVCDVVCNSEGCRE